MDPSKVEGVAAEIHAEVKKAERSGYEESSIMVSVAQLRSWRDRLRIALDPEAAPNNR